MSFHANVHRLDEIRKAFEEIKKLSASDAIDRFCVSGIMNVIEVGDSLYPGVLQEYTRKKFDPLM